VVKKPVSVPSHTVRIKIHYGELTDISAEMDLNDTYINVPLIKFCATRKILHTFQAPAVKKLLPFASTYLCETMFKICCNKNEIPKES
jgi:hypothetical protein